MNPIKKFKSLDPMTKSVVKTCAVQLSITAALIATTIVLEKKNKNDSDEN